MINFDVYIDDNEQVVRSGILTVFASAKVFLQFSYKTKNKTLKKYYLELFVKAVNLIFDNMPLLWLDFSEFCESVNMHKANDQKIDIAISDELNAKIQDITDSDIMRENRRYRVKIYFEILFYVFAIDGYTLYVVVDYKQHI